MSVCFQQKEHFSARNKCRRREGTKRTWKKYMNRKGSENMIANFLLYYYHFSIDLNCTLLFFFYNQFSIFIVVVVAWSGFRTSFKHKKCVKNGKRWKSERRWNFYYKNQYAFFHFLSFDMNNNKKIKGSVYIFLQNPSIYCLPSINF